MKEKQNKRWGLLLISFLCAFLVWLGVVNVADPVMTDTVEVPVEIVNSDVLTKNNLTYEVVGKSTTTVQYEVKTTNAYRIRSSDFRAYADMTDMWSVTGAIPIKIEVLNHSEYGIYPGKPERDHQDRDGTSSEKDIYDRGYDDGNARGWLPNR